MPQRLYAQRWAIPVELAGTCQRVFSSPRAVISLRAFAADPTGLSFLADIKADRVEAASGDFAFDDTRSHDEGACSIRAVDDVTRPPDASDECHLQRGGGGVDEGLGRWIYHLRVQIEAHGSAPTVRVYVSWPRMGLVQESFDIDGAAIDQAAARSRAISSGSD